ncbi:MAG: hypothetical protein QOI61_665 [Actinomycetota bacterium]
MPLVRRIQVVCVFVLAAALISGACSGGSGGSSDGDPGSPKDGEVFLEPLDEVGPNPFTNSVALAAVPAIDATSAAGSPSSQGLRSVRGTTSGLYGGSGSQQVCDPTAAVTFLLDHADKAQAWVDALNADTTLSWSGGAKLALDDIATYVGELTSVFLQADTRVTNHGFKNGRATAFQSVLQRGTAVMVDNRGVPRARCGCFNPLIAPKPAASPKYRGEQWKEFDQTRLVIVAPGAPTETLRIVDIHTKEIIEIYTGQNCLCDRTKQSTTTTTLDEDETTTTTSRNGTTTTIRRATTTSQKPATTVPATTTPTTEPSVTTTSAPPQQP